MKHDTFTLSFLLGLVVAASVYFIAGIVSLVSALFDAAALDAEATGVSLIGSLLLFGVLYGTVKQGQGVWHGGVVVLGYVAAHTVLLGTVFHTLAGLGTLLLFALFVKGRERLFPEPALQ